MSAKPITDFLAKLKQCSYQPLTAHQTEEDCCYNGVSYQEGQEAYEILLEQAFNEFKIAVCDISITSPQLNTIETIKSDLAKIGFWDIPTESDLERYEKEYATGKYPTHRTTIREIKFLQGMVGVQKSYLQQTEEFLKGILSDKSPKEPIEQIQEKPKEKEQPNEQEKTTDKEKKKNGTIGGIRGLKDYLGCSKSTAQAISNDGALKKAGIQYMAGNKWFWKKKELDAYLKANPEILRRVRNRRRS